ncbi:MAG: hypothetical protein WC683_06355 [bacterium]
MSYIPRREFCELMHHVCSHGQPAAGRYSDTWRTFTGGLEVPRISTCNITVHAGLAICGCAEQWITPPQDWPPSPNAIRLWQRQIEMRRPHPSVLLPGDLLVWRVASPMVHIGVFLSTLPEGLLCAEGGQPGGKLKIRPYTTQIDVAVPLHRLLWDEGTAPTVGAWREAMGLQEQRYAVCEDFIEPELLAMIDRAV